MWPNLCFSASFSIQLPARSYSSPLKIFSKKYQYIQRLRGRNLVAFISLLCTHFWHHVMWPLTVRRTDDKATNARIYEPHYRILFTNPILFIIILHSLARSLASSKLIPVNKRRIYSIHPTIHLSPSIHICIHYQLRQNFFIPPSELCQCFSNIYFKYIEHSSLRRSYSTRLCSIQLSRNNHLPHSNCLWTNGYLPLITTFNLAQLCSHASSLSYEPRRWELNTVG